MSRRSRQTGGRDDLPLAADINVTSLVDVAFVLLLIFMITAPILQGGLSLDVPRAASQVVTADQDPYIVSVTRDGTYWIGTETQFTWEELQEALPALHEASGRGTLFIEGEGAATWQLVAQLAGFVTLEMDVPVWFSTRTPEPGE